METETHTTTNEEIEHFLPRQQEIANLMEALPLNGIDERAKRVFNVWGEDGVGKSSFLSEFRECENMEEQKVLWLSPTRDSEVDSIREFIVSCSQAVRFPSEPDKEKRIAERIERVQSGKINMMESDDSILIARPSSVENEKPYINQAAASSVGRTEHKRADIQISVGFGGNKASNQAEGFLDSLPLQSMGAELIILYISDLDRLAQTVKDWLREWVIPAATKGPYRRNLVILFESREPSNLHSHKDNWGDWSDMACDFRIFPLSQNDIHQFGISAKLDRPACHMLYTETLGYPDRMPQQIRDLKTLSASSPHTAFATIRDSLDEHVLAKLAACCLPKKLYPSELDAIFGYKKGVETFEWLRSLANVPLTQDPKTKFYTIDNQFRFQAIEAAIDSKPYKSYETNYLSYGRLCRNVPSLSCRNKLYLLSGLNWIEGTFCDALFGSSSEKVFHFIANTERFFVRKYDHYHISERVRSDLAKVAEHMSHVGMGSIREKAIQLWADRRSQIETTILDLERAYKITVERADKLARKQKESAAYLRVVERKGRNGLNQSKKSVYINPSKKSNGPAIAVLILLAFIGFSMSSTLESDMGLVSFGSGMIAFLIALILIPGWLKLRKTKRLANRPLTPDSPDFVRRESTNILHALQDEEVAIEEIKRDIDRSRLQLQYSLV